MEFTEFLSELVSIGNLPITILMGLVVCYWLMVIVGVFGMDAFDIDLGLDADFEIDLDVDPGFDADGSGLFGGLLAFMHLGDVPSMIVGSLFVVFLWTCTVASNFGFNTQHNVLVSLAFVIPNILISLLATKAILWPFFNLFKGEEIKVETRENMIGLQGVVKTTEITDSFGQLEIQIDGPAIVINARTFSAERLAKGDCAKIVAYNSANDTFTVSLSKWEKD